MSISISAKRLPRWREPMKYLCLIYIEEKLLEAMPPEQYNGVVKQCLEYENEVAQSGGLLAVEALEPINTATTVRVRNLEVLGLSDCFVGTPQIFEDYAAPTKYSAINSACFNTVSIAFFCLSGG
jgi:hypothetical protein